ISAGILNASSTGNSDAGSISILSDGRATVDQLIAAAPGTGSGGGIFIVVNNLKVTGTDANQVSINPSSPLGSALRGRFRVGALTIETKSDLVMHIFQNAVQPPPAQLPGNYIAGIIDTSGGVKGGSQFFQSNATGRPIVNVNPQFPTEGAVLRRS